MENYFLSSTESYKLDYVRKCTYLRELKFSSGKRAVIASIDAIIQWEDPTGFNCSDKVVLTAVHENYDIFEIVEFPVFVYVAVLKNKEYDFIDEIKSDDLFILGRGELYETYEDAKNHIFY